MSHWTTSGRSRLKAKQKESFLNRAQQWAAAVKPNKTMGQESVIHPSKETRKTHHRHHGSDVRRNKANPIIRGIAITVGNRRDNYIRDDDEGSLTHPLSQPQQSLRLRRIRDPNATRYTEFRGSSSISHGGLRSHHESPIRRRSIQYGGSRDHRRWDYNEPQHVKDPSFPPPTNLFPSEDRICTMNLHRGIPRFQRHSSVRTSSTVDSGQQLPLIDRPDEIAHNPFVNLPQGNDDFGSLSEVSSSFNYPNVSEQDILPLDYDVPPIHLSNRPRKPVLDDSSQRSDVLRSSFLETPSYDINMCQNISYVDSPLREVSKSSEMLQPSFLGSPQRVIKRFRGQSFLESPHRGIKRFQKEDLPSTPQAHATDDATEWEEANHFEDLQSKHVPRMTPLLDKQAKEREPFMLFNDGMRVDLLGQPICSSWDAGGIYPRQSSFDGLPDCF